VITQMQSLSGTVSVYPKFEGRVTPNEDEYQKSVWFILTYCLGVS